MLPSNENAFEAENPVVAWYQKELKSMAERSEENDFDLDMEIAELVRVTELSPDRVARDLKEAQDELKAASALAP